MIAKLRVGCTVAGCAPGVRTITRRVLFHCTTGLTAPAAEFCKVCCSSSCEAPKELLPCIKRLAQTSISVTKVFAIKVIPLSFCRKIRRSGVRQWRSLLDARHYLDLGVEEKIPWSPTKIPKTPLCDHMVRNIRCN